MKLLAIDPGPVQSAWVVYDTDTAKPVAWEKMDNDFVLGMLEVAGHGGAYIDLYGDVLVNDFMACEECAIEMVASYGMPVGADVFDTCRMIGRLEQQWSLSGLGGGEFPTLVFRRDVKLHLCGQARAKDTNVRQALIDRYGPGKDKAVGLKASQGPLYGLKADCWQALALAVTAAETRLERAA